MLTRRPGARPGRGDVLTARRIDNDVIDRAAGRHCAFPWRGQRFWPLCTSGLRTLPIAQGGSAIAATRSGSPRLAGQSFREHCTEVVEAACVDSEHPDRGRSRGDNNGLIRTPAVREDPVRTRAAPGGINTCLTSAPEYRKGLPHGASDGLTVINLRHEPLHPPLEAQFEVIKLDQYCRAVSLQCRSRVAALH